MPCFDRTSNNRRLGNECPDTESIMIDIAVVHIGLKTLTLCSMLRLQYAIIPHPNFHHGEDDLDAGESIIDIVFFIRLHR